MPRVLFVAMVNSIHAARWIGQLSGLDFDVHVFPCQTAGPHPLMTHATTHFTGLGLRAVGLSVALAQQARLKERLGVSSLPAVFDRSLWLARAIRRLKPDLVHSLEFQHAGYLTLKARERLHGRFPTWVATNWGSDISLFGQLPEHAPRIREILETCDYYSCECERDVNLAREMGLRGTVLPVLPNGGGYNLEKARSLRSPVPTSVRRTIVLKGYQGWAGRALVGLRALELCASKLEGYRIAMYLTSPEVELAARLFSARTGIPVEIVPRTSHEEILRLHGSARISIGLSIGDAISTSLLEAILMGAFPVQSCTACAEEWIEDEKTGFVVPPEDPQIVAAAIERALDDDGLVDRAAELNWRTCENRLDRRRIQPQVAAMYWSILRESGEARWKELPTGRRVFTTGVYGSGKTMLAGKYAVEQGLPYLDFDSLFTYSSKDNQSRRILGSLPDTFVMDAIPVDENYTWKDFSEYEASHKNVRVIWVYCPNGNEWLKRVNAKIHGRRDALRGFSLLRARAGILYRSRNSERIRQVLGSRKGLWRQIVRAAYIVAHAGQILATNTHEQHLRAYRSFYVLNVPATRGFQDVLYYDSCACEYTPEETMLERVGFPRLKLEHHLDKPSEGYDWKYQDIEVLNFTGYSGSPKTWKRIARLVDWRGKRVVDLGCNHGYFSFKAEDAGSRVIGLDQSCAVLETARLINDVRGGAVSFRLWVAGEEVPESDIILCLNVLHHFDDPGRVLGMMNASHAILEVKKEQVDLVGQYFPSYREVRSHRAGRAILLCDAGRRETEQT